MATKKRNALSLKQKVDPLKNSDGKISSIVLQICTHVSQCNVLA